MSEKGYMFPDPIDPGELVCIKVYVPKHSLYIGAFWRAYEFFTAWNAWMRDPLKKGRLVAQVWRVAFDKARAYYELTKGVCMANITGIRQDPLDPCRVQVQYDGGAWTQVMDMSCCGGGGGGGGGCVPPLRVGTNGSIESYDPETGEWSDTAPGIDPSNSENTEPPYPGDPEAQCKTANGYYAYITDTLGYILSAALTAGNWGQYALDVMAWIAAYFNLPGAIFAGLTALLETVYNFADIDTTARIDARDTIDFFCEVFTNTGIDGTYTQANLDSLVSVLNDLAAAEPVDAKKWWYVHAADIVQITGLTAANKAAKYRIDTPLDCTDCEWVADIDFRESNGGFQAQLVDPFSTGSLKRYGSYVPGEGWKSTNDGPAGAPNHNQMTVTLATDTFELHMIDIYTQQDAEGGPCYDYYPHPGDGIDGWAVYVTSTLSALSGVLTSSENPYTCQPALHVLTAGITPVVVDRITIIGGVGSLGVAPEQGTLWARRIRLYGKGPIPPQLAPFITGA